MRPEPEHSTKHLISQPGRALIESTPAPEALVPDAQRLHTLLPAQLLQGGEVIVLLIKPSAWWIVLEPIGTLAAFACLIALGWGIDATGLVDIARREFVVVGVTLMAVRLFWQFLDWLGRVYVLTDRRVIRVEGVLRVNVFETALKNITHTQTTFSVRERLFGLGTLAFATAGTAGVEAFWRTIARPLEVHQIVVQTLNRYR
ncbi:MAG: PH domain-containing protein [Phycisphaera sp.]|nr:PH domain-containing protein [Phycisphaera sp.]